MLIVTILWGPSTAHVTLDSPEMEQHVLVNTITLFGKYDYLNCCAEKKCHLLPIQSKSSTDGEKGRHFD